MAFLQLQKHFIFEEKNTLHNVRLLGLGIGQQMLTWNLMSTTLGHFLQCCFLLSSDQGYMTLDFLINYSTQVLCQPLRFLDTIRPMIYQGRFHLAFPGKEAKFTQRGFCTLAQGFGSFATKRFVAACVFLIIFPWIQSLAFVPKAPKAGHCSSQSRETSFVLMVWREMNPQPLTQSGLLLSIPSGRGLIHSLTTHLLSCWASPPPPPLPSSISHPPQQGQVFLEQKSYYVTTLLQHLQQFFVTYMGNRAQHFAMGQ